MKPATSLPWRFALDSYGVQRIWGISHGETCDIASTEGDGSIPYPEREVNAAYIVHACNNYTRLVALLKAIVTMTDAEMDDGDGARDACSALLKDLGESIDPI